MDLNWSGPWKLSFHTLQAPSTYLLACIHVPLTLFIYVLQTYHSRYNEHNGKAICGTVVLPLKTKVRGPALPCKTGRLAILCTTLLFYMISVPPCTRAQQHARVVRIHHLEQWSTQKVNIDVHEQNNVWKRRTCMHTWTRASILYTGEIDVVDEAIKFYRANVLFRTFKPQGPADLTVCYLTVLITELLRFWFKSKCDQEGALKNHTKITHSQVYGES